jgi:hypothetical protein
VDRCFEVSAEFGYLETAVIDCVMAMRALDVEGVVCVAIAKPEGVLNCLSKEGLCPLNCAGLDTARALNGLGRRVMQIVPFDVQFLLEDLLGFVGDCKFQLAVVNAAVNHFPGKARLPCAHFAISNTILEVVARVQ